MKMSNLDKSMSQILDIPPLEELQPKTKEVTVHKSINAPAPVPATPKSDAEQDYEYVRNTLHELIEKGVTAVDELSELGAADEKARTYEVMAKMIETVAATGDKMVELHKKVKELNTNHQKGGINVDKAVVFTGNAADLLKQIKEG
jgi:hypothetical protein